MAPTVYLITGANRGIGLGFITALARRDNVIVFAGARNPTAADDLQSLVEQYPGKVYIVKLTACDKTENEAAVATIKTIAGRLDVVVACAGIGQFFGPGLETPAEEMRDHFEVNTVGTLVLFQATYPLLTASTPTPKFIPVSSSSGSINEGSSRPLPVLAYGTSKAALNYLARKLHFEYGNLTCFLLNPGRVATDLVTLVDKSVPGDWIKKVPVMSVEECVAGLLPVIDNGTREKSGGMFINYDGGICTW